MVRPVSGEAGRRLFEVDREDVQTRAKFRRLVANPTAESGAETFKEQSNWLKPVTS